MVYKYLGKFLYWISLIVKKYWLMRRGQATSGQGANSPSSSWRIYKYEVFLSFRGTDTRNNFVDHLHAHLLRKGISTFKDDTRLTKGQPISSQLLQAIKDSRVSIVVFSKHYATSTWCLDEMATIVDCHQQLGHIVLPIFYDVDPSHVRKQDGEYQNAFAKHRKTFGKYSDKIVRWKTAMEHLANLGGWDVRGKSEVQEIENIVQGVIIALGHKFSGFADDLIGIQPRVEKLENLLKLRSYKVRVLGIWGMAGIGKTTLATVLYDKISCQFEACCFIENVSKIYRDGGARHGGVNAVQKQIIHQTLGSLNLETYDPCTISGIVRDRLHNKKILIVLDNVDELEQLEGLAINPKLLYKGSRIIITTSNERILKMYGAYKVYNVPLLNDNEARDLFCRKAFKSDESSSSCSQLIPEVLKYAQCLPLAIKVVGSFLYDRDAIQWRDALDRLRCNPNNNIMEVLRISFKGLEREEKEIFLHIACFFKGKKEDYVKRILDCCGLHPHIGIPIIIEKSLITIRNQEIHMHEMLQQLGKEIVREQFPEQPRQWSRLWLCEDFDRVLLTKRKTSNVEAVVLDQEDVSKRSQVNVEELSIMGRLRLLILYHQKLSGSHCYLSNNLQYLLWHSCPLSSLPSDFEPDRLVELNMPNSSIQRFWEGSKHLPCLKRMDLSNSKYLVETPNFEGTPNLERLDLTGCTDLSQLHPSIGLLSKLAFLSLEGCCSLVSLDFNSESNLSCLTVLHLSGCTKLENTPNFTGLSNLEYLDIDQCTSLSEIDESIDALAKLKFLSLRHCTNLVGIPNSINYLKSLITLDLWGCPELVDLPLAPPLVSFPTLKSLICLDVGFCNLSEVPPGIRELEFLERLNLEGNNFVSLPDTTKDLSCLAYLNLSHCHELQYLPECPSIGASPVGRYFETVSGARNHRSGFYVFDCPRLTQPSGRLTSSESLASSWHARLVLQPRHFRCGFDIVVPGYKIPARFDRVFNGDKIIRMSKADVDDKWTGFAFCAAFELNHSPTNSGPSLLPHPLYLSFESQYAEERFDMLLSLQADKIGGSEHLWLIYISRPHCHFVKNGARITFKALPHLKIRQWGLHRVAEQVYDALDFPGHEQSMRAEGIRSAFNLCEHEQEPMGLVMALSDAMFPCDCLHTEDMDESSRSSGSKIQLPYNWLVTEDEENENMEAKRKENRLANVGLG